MDDLDTQRQRAAHNQSLFREVNERIATLSRRFASELQPNFYVCECLDTTCTEMLALTFGEYERIREHGHFFVLPGHEDRAVETVVEANDKYIVVEKLGVGAEIAETMNPRDEGAV